MAQIHHAETGKGFPVILIHGFCETNEIWNPFREGLSKHYRILTPDLPGFGASPLPKNDFTIDDIADILFEWLENLGIGQTVIIGHSLGGYITLSLARYHPEILRGFSLFHSTAYADDGPKKSSRNKTIAFVKGKGVEVFAQSFIPQLFYTKNRKIHGKYIKLVTKIAAKTPQNTLIQYTKAMRDRFDRTDLLRDFDQPILLVGGDQDTALPIDKIEEQALIPKKSVLHILKNTGHMGMYEKQSEALNIIKDYLSLCKD